MHLVYDFHNKYVLLFSETQTDRQTDGRTNSIMVPIADNKPIIEYD